MKHVFFWEYDEPGEDGRGLLKKTTAQGVIVNTQTKEVVTFPTMITNYAQTVTHDEKHVLFGSNALGKIEMREIATGKRVKQVRTRKGLYHFLLSNSGDKLYAFNKNAIEVFRFPELKHIESIPLSQLIPGMTKMLVIGHPLTLNKGRLFIFHAMKKTNSGYWHKDRDNGFQMYGVAP